MTHIDITFDITKLGASIKEVEALDKELSKYLPMCKTLMKIMKRAKVKRDGIELRFAIREKA
jgi:uncharacterized ubiquitin-like protein YukD